MRVEIDGSIYDFPNDATDDEINASFTPPSADVVAEPDASVIFGGESPGLGTQPDLITGSETAREEPSFIREVAIPTVKDTWGVLEKVKSKIIQGMTVGAINPEAGTVGVPFTDLNVKTGPPLAQKLQEEGVSPAIANYPEKTGNEILDTALNVASGFPQMIGGVGPWSTISSNITRAIAAKRVADATAKGIEVASPLLSPIERIGVQGLTGGIFGAAQVRQNKEETLLNNALGGAAWGIGLQAAGEAVAAIMSKFNLGPYAYENLKKELSDLFFTEKEGVLSKSEADFAAEYILNNEIRAQGKDPATELRRLRKAREQKNAERAARGEEPIPEGGTVEETMQRGDPDEIKDIVPLVREGIIDPPLGFGEHPIVRQIEINQVPDAIDQAVEGLAQGNLTPDQLIDQVASQIGNVQSVSLPEIETPGNLWEQAGQPKEVIDQALAEGRPVPLEIIEEHALGSHHMAPWVQNYHEGHVGPELLKAVATVHQAASGHGIPISSRFDAAAERATDGQKLSLDISDGSHDREILKKYGYTEDQINEFQIEGTRFNIYGEYLSKRKVVPDRSDESARAQAIFYNGAEPYDVYHELGHHLVQEGILKVPEGTTEEMFAKRFGEGAVSAPDLNAFIESLKPKYSAREGSKRENLIARSPGLSEFFQGNVPHAIIRANAENVQLRGSDLRGFNIPADRSTVRVSREDVANFKPGDEQLGAVSGPHEGLKRIAGLLNNWFKYAEAKAESGAKTYRSPKTIAELEESVKQARAEYMDAKTDAEITETQEAYERAREALEEAKNEPARTAGGNKEPGVSKPDTGKYSTGAEKGRIAGDKISTPKRSYPEAAREKGNPWVRLSDAPTNKGRTILVQFTTDLMGKYVDQASKYYDKIYSKRKGYDRLQDFWEIPQWMGNVARFLPDADVYVVREMDSAKAFLESSGYDHVVFSSMDVNQSLIKELAPSFPGKVSIGGYADPKVFKGIEHTYYSRLEDLAKDYKTPFLEGSDYRHFSGAQVIPRLTMSQGCKYKCAFCTVPKKLEVSSGESVDQQVESFKNLDAKLVYLNDKTFGQANNYQYLSELNTRLKEQNPGFEGFIVQTTASDLMKMPEEFLKNSGIKYVELGVESYNDLVLRGLHKPHNVRVIELATDKLRKLGINLVPNVIIGIPEESAETYKNTLDYLKKNQDIISHANIYNLAIYEGTELGSKDLVKQASDQDENVLEKSFHTDKQIHQDFADNIYKMMGERLDEPPAYSIRPTIDKGTRKEMREIISAAKKNKTYMQAPNGKPSKLSEERWALVRTGNFKAWFGDWEKYAMQEGGVWSDDRKEVSKVVDENGEPLVVYHGTKKGGFSVFDPNERDKHAVPSIFFTNDTHMAATYGGGNEITLSFPKTQEDLEELGWEFEQGHSGAVRGWDASGWLSVEEPTWKKAIASALDQQAHLPAGKEIGQYPVFLNIRDPLEEDFEGANWDGTRQEQYVVYKDGEIQYDEDTGKGYFTEDEADAFAERIGGGTETAPDHYQTTNSVVKEAKKYGNDGAIIREVTDSGGVPSAYGFEPADVFVVFDPRQAKSASFNTGEFNPENEDMRYSARTDTPEFKKWFGDSKVVDEEGKPLVVYHGTRHGFTKFDVGEEGAFFAKQPSTAGVFTLRDPEESYEEYDEGARILPTYLSIINPLVITPDEYLDGKKKNGQEIGGRRDLQKEGYDGIRITPNATYGPEWSADVWVAFSSTQVKSATGNVGAYDPNNPDIRYSVRPEDDKRYLSAVNKGDMEAAQKMVDEAAKKAGYEEGPLFHGTTHKFTVFKSDRGTTDNDFGKAFYFTNAEEDVDANYHGVGPDLKNRIERRAEQILADLDPDNELEYGSMAYRKAVVKAEKMAEEELVGEEERVIKTYVSLKNPAILGGKNETRLEMDYNEDTEEWGGSLVDFVAALRNEASLYDGEKEAQKAIDVIMDASGYESIPLREAIRLWKIHDSAFIEDSNGDLMSNQIVRDVLEREGFDGIVDNTVDEKFGTRREHGQQMHGVGPETTHIIAFNPEQIKSADPVTYDDKGNVILLSERFNEASPDIRYSIGAPKKFQGKMITLTHWTTKEGLKQTNPKFEGTGSQGAEKYRQGQFHVPVTFFAVPPYKKESFLNGPFRYSGVVDGDKIYDIENDPLNLYPSDDEMKKKRVQLTELKTRLNLYEKKIKKGFDGFYSESTGVVGMFVPVDVEPQKPSDKAVKYSVSEKRSLGAKILSGEVEPPKLGSLHEVAQYLSKGKPIDFKTATARQNKVVEDALKEMLDISIEKHPEALEWYQKDIEKTMAILGDIYPGLKKPDHSFRMRLAIALTSDGNKTTENVEIGSGVYENWNEGKFETKKGSRRGDAISDNLRFADELSKKFKNDAEFEKWLLGKDTVKNISKELSTLLDIPYIDARQLLSGELVDAVVPRAFVFGPKVGAFFANLSGDFDALTPDMWFMRTIGRITGTLIKEIPPGKIDEARNRFKESLTLKVLEAVQGGDLFGVDKRIDEIALRMQRQSMKVEFRNLMRSTPGGDEARLAANALSQLLEGERNEAPSSGAHRAWLRDRMDNVKGDYSTAASQAALWIGEKEIYHAFGIKGEKGNYFSDGANALYERIHGRPSPRIAGTAGRVEEGSKAGAQEGLFSAREDKKIHELIKANPDGFTIDPRKSILVTSGYAVAPSKTTETLFVTLEESDITDYLSRFKLAFGDPRAMLGGWKRGDGKFVLDVSYVFQKLKDAVYVGELGGQDAVGRLGEYKEYKVSNEVQRMKSSGEYSEEERDQLRHFKESVESSKPSVREDKTLEDMAGYMSDEDLRKLYTASKDFKDHLSGALEALGFPVTKKLTPSQQGQVSAVVSAALARFREGGGNERTVKRAVEALGFPVDEKKNIKTLVREMTGQVKVNDLNMKEIDALNIKIRAEAAAARKAFVAGKYEAAARTTEKYRTMIDIARERRNTGTEIRKMIDHMKTAEKKIPDMTPKYGEEVRKLLEPFDMSKMTERTQVKLTALREELQNNPEADIHPDMLEALDRLDKTAVRDLTVSDMRTLHDAVMHYATLGVRGPKMIVAQRKIAREMVQAQSLKEMIPAKELAKDLIDISYSKSRSARGALLGLKNQFGIHSLAWDALVESVTGMKSLYYQIMYREVKAGIKKRDSLNYQLEDEMIQSLENFRGKHGIKDIANWLDESQDIKLPGTTLRLNRNQKLSFYRGWMDPDWRRSVEEGGFGLWADPHKSNPNRVYKIGPEGFDAIIKSMTPAEVEYADAAVPNIIKSGKLISDKFLEINGYNMPMPESGIYWRKDVMAGERGKDEQAEFDKKQFTRPGIFKGMTKQRTGSSKAVWLKPFTVAMGEMHKRAADYVALEEAMSNAAWLHYKLRPDFEERYGMGLFKEIEKGLKDIAEVYPMEMETYSDALFRKIRNNNTVYALALNYGTMLKQLNGPINYMVYVPPKYLAWAAMRYLENPRAVRRLHKEMSVQYRKRGEEGYTQDVGNVLSGLNQYGQKPGVIKRFGAAGLMPLRQIDLFGVDLGMLASVEHALESFETGMSQQMQDALGITDAKGLTHGEKMKLAYEWADWTTERSQAQNVPEHMSGWQRGNELEKQFSMFFSEVQKNVSGLYRAYKSMERGDPKSSMLMAKTLFFYILLGSVLIDTGVTAMRSAIRGQKADRWWAGIIKNMAGMVPIVRDITQAVVDSIQGKHFPSSGDTPAARIQEAVTKPVTAAVKISQATSYRKRKEAALATANAAADLLAMGLGIPYPALKEPWRIANREETIRKQRK